MDDAERPTSVFLRVDRRRFSGRRGTLAALRAVVAEMYPEVFATPLPPHAHLWCVVGEGRSGPAWATCHGCGLSVPGRGWRDVDFDAWVQYVDPDGLQRAFMAAAGLPLQPEEEPACP